MRTLSRTFAIVALLAFAFGCSSDDNPTGGGGNTDTTPPGIASINPIDKSQVELTFTEAVSKATAEREANYVIVEQSPSPAGPATVASPGDTVGTASATLSADQKTVTVSTSQDMGNLPYEMTVTGVEDLQGNRINTPATQDFTGSDANDTTPPQVIMRSPAPGETNVGIGEAVVVQFSEPMDFNSVAGAFQWTWASGIVSWEINEQSGNTYAFTPTQPVMNGVTYTATMGSGAMDWAGNALMSAPVTWSFTTTNTVDNTPPTLVSSTPTNGAANVPVGVNLVLTFSEAVEQTSLDEVFITPEIGDGVPVWSNGGRTVTFDADTDLMDNTQYTFIIIPGGVRDLAGNGNTSVIQILWSTGSTFESGGIRGTIAGDAQSATANDPTGAVVIAATSNPFGENDDFDIGGSTTVEQNDTYAITNVADGWYFPLSVLDSNGDGNIDPSLGDAVGLFGVNFTDDFEADSVEITLGQTRINIDFALFDPTTILGTVDYTGAMMGGYQYFVGAFDTTGFDINNIGEPDYGTEGDGWPNNPDYVLGELDSDLQPGTYFVGAYLDVNFNQMFDDGIDPAGFFGGNNSPTPLTLTHGQDAFDIDITLVDPGTRSVAPPVSWTSGESALDPRVRATVLRIQRALEKRR